MPKHTPEPLEIPRKFPLRFQSTDRSCSGAMNVPCPGGKEFKEGREIAEATCARLVACYNGCAGINPDAVQGLLAACKAALHVASVIDRWDTCEPGTSPYVAFQQLRAAIAKAEEV